MPCVLNSVPAVQASVLGSRGTARLMELTAEDAAVSAVVERHAADTVLPYLRAFDAWQRNINLADPNDPSLLACKATVEGVAGEDGAALQACIEEVQQLRKPHGEPSKQYERMHGQWLQVVKCLLTAHQRLVLTCPRKHPRRGDAGMTRGVKYRLYALRNAPELRSLRSYWLAARCTGDAEAAIDEAQWNAVEGLASDATGGGSAERESERQRETARESGLAPDCAPVVDVLHQTAPHPNGLARRWSLFVPARCQPASVPLVLALHGARTPCDQHLLSWLPTARAHGFAVLSLQSLGQSWGLHEREEAASDMISLLTTLDSVLAEYPSLDRGRIFLTGMSDGGTFSYCLSDVLSRACCTFAAGLAVTAAFPVPSRMSEAEIESLRGTPTLHVHGTKDWMFPIEVARAADATAREVMGEGEWQFTEVPGWTHASPSAVHEAVVWPWLAALPRNSSFSGDVQEVLRKFLLFCAGESSDSDVENA